MTECVTVIVGAGVIGLCTALELAKRRTKGTKIYVFDVLDSVFAATSAHNTGCLHFRYPPAQAILTPLGQYSFKLWEAVSNDTTTGRDFNKIVGFVRDACFSPNEGSGQRHDGFPDWVELDPSWDIDHDPLGRPNALINPARLGKWLAQQCEAHGVDIILRTRITKVVLGKDGRMTQTWFKAAGGSEWYMDCQALVLATGPWTPQVVADLFPRNSVDLHAWPIASDWLILKSPRNPNNPPVGAVLLEGIVHHKLEFAARNDGTLWACNRRVYGKPVGPVGEISAPDVDVIAELKAYCQRYLKPSEACDQEFEILEEGRSFRPATRSELPIISSVPLGLLEPHVTNTASATEAASGVYLCCGHGSWGVGLGMGSARLLTQIMNDEMPDVDLSAFTLRSGNGAGQRQ